MICCDVFSLIRKLFYLTNSIPTIWFCANNPKILYLFFLFLLFSDTLFVLEKYRFSKLPNKPKTY